MREHLKLLGLKVRDGVTGVEGVVTSVCFDLYGCVQVAVQPRGTKDGKLEDGRWFDEKRIKVLDKKPVMDVPTFDVIPGPAVKPHRKELPTR